MKTMKSASVLATLLASLTLVASARADFIVRVDNQSNPAGATTWSSPPFSMKVYAKFSNGTHEEVDVPWAENLDEIHDVTIHHSYPQGVDWIMVYNTSDDMFGIDQVQVLRTDYWLLQTWGADNQNAWCSSIDPNDGYTAECGGTSNPACDGYKFYPNGVIQGYLCT